MMIGRKLIQRITIFASSGIKEITQEHKSQETLNLRRFLARFLLRDNRMTIILEIILY